MSWEYDVLWQFQDACYANLAGLVGNGKSNGNSNENKIETGEGISVCASIYGRNLLVATRK